MTILKPSVNQLH